jgi:membrane fusion protein, multidrug efflux system
LFYNPGILGGMNVTSDSYRRVPLRIAALVTLLVLAGCGGESDAAPAAKGGPGGGGPGGRGGGRPSNVETALVETGDVSRTVTVSGVVEPIRTIGVNSQLAGALLSVRVEEGSQVSQGQVLAQIDDRELAAQEGSAVANFNVAKAKLDRSEQLRTKQFITAEEYERDRTAYVAAEAALDQLRTRRGYAVVRAPVSGVVLQKLVESGDAVGQNTRLFNIGDISTKVVRAGVSELDVGTLRPGTTVQVALDAVPGRQLTGRVRRIFPSADPTTRLVPVEVALEGEAMQLARPGFLARLTLPAGTQRGVLLVPASAIQGSTGNEAVFVVTEGKASRRVVQTGGGAGEKVQIVSGLREGEIVVKSGGNAVRDGAEVRIVNGPGKPVAATAASGNAKGGAE